MACYSVDRRVENSLGRHVRPNKVRILGVDAIENFLGYRQNGFLLGLSKRLLRQEESDGKKQEKESTRKCVHNDIV